MLTIYAHDSLFSPTPSCPFSRRDEIEAEIRARLEANERVQQERARVEEQISAKLDAEMQAFVALQRQLLMQQQQYGVPLGQDPVQAAQVAAQASISSPSLGHAPPTAMTVPGPVVQLPHNGTPRVLQLQQALPLVQQSQSFRLSLDIGDGGTLAQAPGLVGMLSGMTAQISQASLEPSTASDGSIALNLRIDFSPAASPAVHPTSSH